MQTKKGLKLFKFNPLIFVKRRVAL